MRFGLGIKSLWPLEPEAVYLNHGTLGVTPHDVLAAQQKIRLEIEAQPARFMHLELRPRLRRAAQNVAAELGGRGQDYAFVENASAGINAVLRGLDFAEGDEILYLSHAYGAVKHAIAYVARRTGAVPVAVALPYPPGDEETMLAPLGEALNERTKLAVLDHVTSETALILPLARMIALCHDQGVPVLVDGAHAPAMIELDIPGTGADWYAGNLHKWMFAPRGCGILWTPERLQAETHPLTISWGYESGYAAEFDWTGTHDFSRYLSVPAAIAFMHRLDAGRMRRYNHDLVRAGAELVADALGQQYTMPEAMTGAMTLVPIGNLYGDSHDDALKLRRTLREEHAVELQVVSWGGQLWTRLAAQVYNALEDFERLAAALRQISSRPAQGK